MKFLLALLLAFLLLMTNASASLRPLEEELAERTNNVRRHRDIRKLDVGPKLSRFARRYARKMARRGEIFHSRFSSGRIWGENVGRGRSVRQVFRAMMRSRDHRRNILRRQFRKVGIGVVKSTRGIWVVQLFTGDKPATTEDTQWVDLAKSQVGTPYAWGGSSPGGFDCSGFTSWVVANATGHTLPHSSEGQRQALPSVSKEDLEPGDLLFFHYSDRNGAGTADHAEVYLGGNQAIGTEDGGVAVQAVDWSAFIQGGSTGIDGVTTAPQSFETNPIRRPFLSLPDLPEASGQ